MSIPAYNDFDFREHVLSIATATGSRFFAPMKDCQAVRCLCGQIELKRTYHHP